MAGSGPALLDLADTLLHFIRQAKAVDLFEQRCMQPAAQAQAIGEGATIENRIAFAPGCYQPGLGQHLEVVAHAGLADGEDLRQLQHAKRVAGQCP
ncbi:hypothetical protein D9M71_466440 [compost metagenome]